MVLFNVFKLSFSISKRNKCWLFSGFKYSWLFNTTQVVLRVDPGFYKCMIPSTDHTDTYILAIYIDKSCVVVNCKLKKYKKMNYQKFAFKKRTKGWSQFYNSFSCPQLYIYILYVHLFILYGRGTKIFFFCYLLEKITIFFV